MPALIYLNAVAFVSSQNHPILIRTFGQERENNKDIRYHYIAHTSLDVFEERSQSPSICESDLNNHLISLKLLRIPRIWKRIWGYCTLWTTLRCMDISLLPR